jgi:ribosomal protein L27
MASFVQLDQSFTAREEQKFKGKDDTLFAMIDGIVKYERIGRDRKQASVYSVEQ